MKLATQGYHCYHASHVSKLSAAYGELLRGVLDLCLLAVMNEGPAYGYEMTKRLRERGLAAVGEGSIYPLLGRLERDGLAQTTGRRAARGRTASTTVPSTPAAWRSRWASANGAPPATPSMRCSPLSRSRCFMTDFLEQCRAEWRHLGVSDELATEMATDLASDLAEAEADGVSAEVAAGQ